MKVSIIIPVFNKLEYTKKCIDALYRVTPKFLFELIVVNNGSKDGTKEYLDSLSAKVENVKVIHNMSNLGFAKACNQGARIAKGNYLLFLNNDTIPLEGWLEELIKTAEEEEKVGVVGSKLLFPDGKIQHAGVEVCDYLLPITPFHIYYREPADIPEANIKKEYPAVTGACMLTPKWLFDELGGFDEGFLNGFEDVDYCFRVKEKGYRIIYNPKSVLYHFESVTEGRFNAVKENEERLIRKWKGKVKVRGTKVSVVIVNYNSWKDTVHCIDSLVRNVEYAKTKIIVVDNGSKKEDLLNLKRWLEEKGFLKRSDFEKEVVLLETGENRGFAGGSNIGIRYALEKGSEYIWLLNCDTEIEKKALENSLYIAELKKNNAGIVASKIYCFEKRDMVQFDGRSVPYYSGKKDRKDSPCYIEKYAPFCSVLIRREVFEDVGLLNEEYFLYFEDNEFCKRVLEKGWKIIYNPYSKVYHKGGATVGSWLRTPISSYYATRNLLLFYKEDIHGCFDAIRRDYWRDLKKTKDCLKGFVEGIKDFLVGKKGKVDEDVLHVDVWKGWPDERLKESAKGLLENPTEENLTRFLSMAQAYLMKDISEEDPEYLYSQGEKLYREGKTEEAISVFEKVIRLNPKHALAYNNLGAIYWQKGEKKKALECMIKAMEIDPENPDIIWNSGQILIGLGLVSDAREIYEFYLKRHSDSEMEKFMKVFNKFSTSFC